jgi:hypothetical protein
MKRAVLLSTIICGLFAMESMSRAEIPPLLRPGTHPMWASLAMGGGLGVSWSSGGYSGGAGGASQFKLIEQFGYHLSSNFGGPAAGPAIAIDLQESFGGDTSTVIEILPRFVWDIPIIQNLGLYLSPSLGIGYARIFGGDGVNAATIQLDFEGKLILGDRGFVFFRPFGLDIMASSVNGNSYTLVRWDLMFGGGVIF